MNQMNKIKTRLANTVTNLGDALVPSVTSQRFPEARFSTHFLESRTSNTHLLATHSLCVASKLTTHHHCQVLQQNWTYGSHIHFHP